MIRSLQRPSPPQPGAATAPGPEVLSMVAAAIGRLGFGVIQLTVHDGKVVQLDVTERQRFQS